MWILLLFQGWVASFFFLHDPIMAMICVSSGTRLISSLAVKILRTQVHPIYTFTIQIHSANTYKGFLV